MFISLWASRLTIIMPTPPVKKLNRLLAYHRKSALLLFVLRYYCILNIVCSFRFELPSDNYSIARTPNMKQHLQSWISSIPSIIFQSRPSTNRCTSVPVLYVHFALSFLGSMERFFIYFPFPRENWFEKERGKKGAYSATRYPGTWYWYGT